MVKVGNEMAPPKHGENVMYFCTFGDTCHIYIGDPFQNKKRYCKLMDCYISALGAAYNDSNLMSLNMGQSLFGIPKGLLIRNMWTARFPEHQEY